MLIFAISVLILASVPVFLFLANLAIFKPPQRDSSLEIPGVSILIPARNEANNIRTIVESAILSTNVELEVIVLDDGSEDETVAIVEELAKSDSRIQLRSGDPLPQGWAGKMYACWQLAQAASHPWLLFVDADVRMAPDAARRMIDFARTSETAPVLVSGPPRQITGTWGEKLLLPLIHFVLLGFLPLREMRRSLNPGLGAAVGQVILAHREAYFEVGGHSKIASSFHDGLNLPRAFREAGKMTDLTEIGDLMTCRMYHNAKETWDGLLKNAAEGMGAPKTIGPMTVLLIGGQVLPWIGLFLSEGLPQQLFLLAASLGVGLRALAAIRFQQSWFGVLTHPIGVFVLILIQWIGFTGARTGKRASWKGRSSPKPQPIENSQP
ncbi:MAG: glycosyltransferase family 2 protein [Verrucomicrobiota bacterium]